MKIHVNLSFNILNRGGFNYSQQDFSNIGFKIQNLQVEFRRLPNNTKTLESNGLCLVMKIMVKALQESMLLSNLGMVLHTGCVRSIEPQPQKFSFPKNDSK